MATTYEPIATTTLGSAQSSVTFSSISGSYTDLVLVGVGLSSASENICLRFNGDTGTNYSKTVVDGNGTSASSARGSSQDKMILAAFNSSTQSNLITHIMNYSNSTTYKTVLQRGNIASSLVRADVGLWRSTSAITSITLLVASGTISTGTTFTLYGIKAA
jgi:hypothetical protein